MRSERDHEDGRSRPLAAELGAHAALWLRLSAGRQARGLNLRDYAEAVSAPRANGEPRKPEREDEDWMYDISDAMKEERMIIDRDLERLYPSSLQVESMQWLLRCGGAAADTGDETQSVDNGVMASDNVDDSSTVRERTEALHAKVRRVLYAFQIRRRSVGYTQGMHVVTMTLIRCCEALRSAAGRSADGDGVGAGSAEERGRRTVEDSAEQDAFVLFCTLMEVILPPDFLTPPPAAMNGLCTHTDVLEALLRLRFPETAAALDGPEDGGDGASGFNSFFSPVRMLVQVHSARCYVQLFADMVPLRTLLSMWDLLFAEDMRRFTRAAASEGSGAEALAAPAVSRAAPRVAPAGDEAASLDAALARLGGSADGVPRRMRTSAASSSASSSASSPASSPASPATPPELSHRDGANPCGLKQQWGGGAGLTLLTTSLAIVLLFLNEIEEKGQFQPTLLMNAGKHVTAPALVDAMVKVECEGGGFDPGLALELLSEHRRKRGAQWGLDEEQAVEQLHRSFAEANAASGECSFMYRYSLRESCSQFDSLPLTSLTIPPTRKVGGAAQTRSRCKPSRTCKWRTETWWARRKSPRVEWSVSSLASSCRGRTPSPPPWTEWTSTSPS